MKEIRLLERKESLNDMELISGHPICLECINNIHDHPIDDVVVMEDMRSDCKNFGFIDQKRYQCHCGMGGGSVKRENGRIGQKNIYKN